MDKLEDRILRTNDWGILYLINKKLMKNLDGLIDSDKSNDLVDLLEEAGDILVELIFYFNREDQLSKNVRSLYFYINKLLTRGFLENNNLYFKDARRVLKPLLEAFEEKERLEEGAVTSGLTYGKQDMGDYISRDGFDYRG